MLNLKVFFPMLPRARTLQLGPNGYWSGNVPMELAYAAWEQMTFGGVKVDFIGKGRIGLELW